MLSQRIDIFWPMAGGTREGVVQYLAIGVGAALGANARYLVGIYVAQRLGVDFPWGTFFINVSGSVVIA